MKQVITSLLDLDLYKLTMMQIAWCEFPDTKVEYEYKCRSKLYLPLEVIKEIQHQVHLLGTLQLTSEELAQLQKLPFFKENFVSFLRNFRLNPDLVHIQEQPFSISIKGSWTDAILFETLLLSIVSEVTHKFQLDSMQETEASIYQKAAKKLINNLQPLSQPDLSQFKLIEFGTRRRFSHTWQRQVINILKDTVPDKLVGTSNVKLAFDYNLTPLGTMAHEHLQAFQAFSNNLANSQIAALNKWALFYRGMLGTALTDVISMDAFLRDFDLFFAKVFDTLRHDSGCPFVWANKALKHFKSLGINPQTKSLLFSDSLDIEKAISLYKEFNHSIPVSFGIGTKLTNDLPGIVPVNHVIKLTKCNDQPVAKLSDSPGKSMCKDEIYLAHLKTVFSYNL